MEMKSLIFIALDLYSNKSQDFGISITTISKPCYFFHEHAAIL